MVTYNNSNPEDDVKIRNLPLAVRNNFQAQKAGDSSFVLNRANFFTSATPGTKADMIRVYGKDVSSKTELHSKDESGNVIQLTSKGKIGSTSTQALTSGVSFDNSYFYTASNFIAARAEISSSGSESRADGITSSKASTGKYNVVVASGRLQTDSYQVLVTPHGSNGYFVSVNTKPTVNPATTTTIVVHTRDSSNVLTDREFDVIVIGGR